MQKTQKGNLSILDRPILGGIRLDWWTLLYVGLIALAIFTRLWNLEWRAYCHDESIHASWSWDLYTGKGYRHNPTYHGPFGYHITAFMFFLFGDSDYTGRLAAGLFGVGTVILMLLMRRWLGRWGTLAATTLMIISPIMMHRTRYIRMDPWTILFAGIMFVAILHYLEKRRDIHLYIIAAMFALSLVSKETAFIYEAIFGTFLVILFVVRWWREGRFPWKSAEFDLILLIGTLSLPLISPLPLFLVYKLFHLGYRITDYSNQGIIRSLATFIPFLGISIAIGYWWGRRRWLIAAGIFYLIMISFFTTMFTNGQGFASGMFGSLGYWLEQQEVKRGGQPWYYYFLLVPMYEFLPLLFGLLGIGYWARGALRALREHSRARATEKKGAIAAVPEKAPFVSFVVYWTAMSLVIYSWAGEKMPWLAQNIVLPLIPLAGWFIGQVMEKIDLREFTERRGWLMVVLIPLFILVLVTALRARPFQGTSLDQLGETMRWLLSVMMAVGLAVAFYSIGRRLRASGIWQALFFTTLIVMMALTFRFAWMASFTTGDLASEMMVYAQGTPDVPLVMQEITEMSLRLTGGLDLKVAYDDESSWPFVWYLRNFRNAQYYAKQPSAPFDAAVVIVGLANEPGVKPYLGNKYLRREYRLIWWPSETYKDLTFAKIIKGIGSAESRRNFWNVFFYRKYSYPLSQWPHVNRFAMYVRRDIATQLWDYGPEVVTEEIVLPGEEYEKKLRQVSPLQVWGSEGGGAGQFRYPKGVALDAQGNLYVVDSQNHRVVKLGPNGEHLLTIGGQGNAPGQFNEPWSVAVDAEGYIFVADTWNHRIQRFSPDGQFETMWGIFGDIGGIMPGDPNLFYGPRDIAIDDSGYLYVTDTGNKRVIAFDRDGKYINQWGGPGADNGRFLEPVGIARDGEGNFYVADTWNRRIQKFDKAFNYLAQWPIAGWEGESVVNKPYLAADAAGNVYATDPEMYRIIKFDTKGTVLAVWGQFGVDRNSLNLPTGIAVDGQGNIYVSDSSNHRIVKYGPIQ